MPVIIVAAAPIVPAVTATSLDGYLTVTTDPAYGGVLLVADFSSLPTVPRKVRFARTDGTLVRSGDTAWAPGGIAYAYDLEMPLGVVTGWTATPITETFGVYTDGTTSDSASVLVPDIDETADIWLKSISNPTLSLRVSSRNDAEFALAGRHSLVDMPASEFQSGSWAVPLRQPVTYTFETANKVERDAVMSVLRAGPMLIQALTMYEIDDGYYVFDGLSEQYRVGGYDPRRTLTVTFRPISRPPTASAPLYIPGRSYADVDTAYATYAILDAAKPDYDSIIES